MAEQSSTSPASRRAIVMTGICCVATALVLALQWFVPLQHAENYSQDWLVKLGRKTPLDDRLVLIGIDRSSYDDVIFADDVKGDPVLAALRERFPWSRRVWAALIERLAEAGAKTIVLDLVFAAEGDGDEQLHATLEKYGDRVVIGCNLASELTDRGTNFTVAVPSQTVLTPAGTLPALLDNRVGFVNIWPDDDGVLRRARFRLTNKQAGDLLDAPAITAIESLDTRALDHFGEFASVPDKFNPVRFRFTAPPGTAFKIIPVGDVLTSKIWERNYASGEFFRGKLVFIGPTANIFQDFHRTPFDAPMAGPEVHLNIINAALHGELLRELSLSGSATVIVVIGLLTAAACIFVGEQLKRLAVVAGLIAIVVVAAKIAFDSANLVMPIVSPVLVLVFSGFSALVYDFVAERLERMKLRHTMGLYFSPRVLEAVLADPGSMTPRRADVVLLLTDLRNSTPLAEALGPKGMFELLNRVFEAQTGAIMSEEGNLEHFLGDQFLSYWGAPQAQPGAADRAEHAAKKLIEAMEKLRSSLSDNVQKLFGYGVALHSGSVLVGNKGSALRLDYGLVGDTVNEAARIESLTKHYGVKMLVSRETFAQFSQQGTRRLVDRVIVKGKSEPVELYECENPCTPQNYSELCKRYKAAYDEYFFGHFTQAKELFEKLAEEFNDSASRTLAARCSELAANPPTDWNGIWIMQAK